LPAAKEPPSSEYVHTANAVKDHDSASNRKQAKHQATGRMEGLKAIMDMAFGEAAGAEKLPAVDE